MAAEQPAKAKRKSIFARLRDLGGELKKVSWPSFKTVVKSTGVVIAVSLFFLVIAMGFDSLFGFLYSLLTKGVAA